MNGPFDFYLQVAYGFAALALGMVIRRVAEHFTAPRRHARARERVMELLRRRLEVEAELADIELALAEEHATVRSDPHAMLIVRTVEEARLIPRRMRDLARHFGFAVPAVPEEEGHAHRRDVKPENMPLERWSPPSAWSHRPTNGQAPS